MRRAKRALICGAFLLTAVLAATAILLPVRADAQDWREALDEPWWRMSDREFLERYGRAYARGGLAQRSALAWMLFARVNMQKENEDGRYSRWELWSSDNQTFANPPVWPAYKDRRQGPELQKAAKTPADQIASEEVTRNEDSFRYTVRTGLTTRAGLAKAASEGRRVSFPVGSIEIKAHWTVPPQEPPSGTYTTAGHGLNGLHIMAKYGKAPTDWFWTTFEYKGNPDRDDALRFVTYPDYFEYEGALEDAMIILEMAGLGDTAFVNYRSNGTQIDFVIPENGPIPVPRGKRPGDPVILGNTTMEGAFAVPASSPPSKWTAWNSSCHTCHGQAAAQKDGGALIFDPLSGPYGPLKPLSNAGVIVDFSWAPPLKAYSPPAKTETSESP